ncbi:MAG: hypothetical protein M9947_17075 [Thermomicrobiales bacterium]|nr:hypothetical protein [Thermomicrobiales bacterium]
MSHHSSTQDDARSRWSDDQLPGGIVDLYARRMAMVRTQRTAERQRELDDIVITQPFGRAFTAQPSYPPDPAQLESEPGGPLAGIRRRLAGSSGVPARRKLATS